MGSRTQLSRILLPADAAANLDAATKQAVDAKQASDADLTTIAALAPANDDVLQRKAGAWTNRTVAQLMTDLGAQPLDSDLTTIAGLGATTDSFIQAKASAWAKRTIAQVKTDLGISNVDNTSDANKPVSTAQQAEINDRGIIIARHARTTSSLPGTVTGTPVGVIRLDDISIPTGYTYLIYTNNLRLTGGTNDAVEVTLRATFDGTTPIVSSTAYATASRVIPNAGVYEDAALMFSRTPGSNETLSVLLCVSRISGSAGNAAIGGGATFPIELFVESKGTAVSSTGTNI